MMRLALLFALAVSACSGPSRSTVAPQATTTQKPAPPRESVLTAEKLQLFVIVVDGAEPAIVLEAGGGSDSTMWKTLPEELARATGRKVIAYDRAGFGKSPMPAEPFTIDDELDALRAALRQSGASRVVICGESYGGMFAVAYALRNPNDVVGLVLLEPMSAVFANAVGAEKVLGTAPKNLTGKSDRERAIVRMIEVFPGFVASMTNKTWAKTTPAVIVTGGVAWWPDESMQAPWIASHKTLAEATGAKHVIAERSKHQIAKTEPELVIEQVRVVLSAQR